MVAGFARRHGIASFRQDLAAEHELGAALEQTADLALEAASIRDRITRSYAVEA
jgi:hypothetical protein